MSLGESRGFPETLRLGSLGALAGTGGPEKLQVLGTIFFLEVCQRHAVSKVLLISLCQRRWRHAMLSTRCC